MTCPICGTAHSKCGGPATNVGVPIGAPVKRMKDQMWTADRRIFLDPNGNAVEANDRTRVSLLVAPGLKIPMKQAIELGLVKTEERTPETKAQDPVEDKAVKPVSDKSVKPKAKK